MPDAYFASAYDDQLVIDGNASFGCELASKDFDIVVVPVGGGGLISGVVKGLKRNNSKTTAVGAEPLLGNDAARSLKAGKLIQNETEPTTIADGARTISLGKLNWEIIRENVNQIIEVPEAVIAEALRLYFHLANLKCEPTGALPLAAVLTQPAFFAGKRICLVVSGGNVDPAVYMNVLSQNVKAGA
jgi:threonine dehydratase